MKYCITCGNALTETTFNGAPTLVCAFCGAVVVENGGSYKYGGTFNGSVPARRFISENKNKEVNEVKNKELIKLRVDHDLTQTDMAKICGVSVGTYNLVENGKRRGSKELWHKIQAYFKLDGEQMWKLQNPEI